MKVQTGIHPMVFFIFNYIISTTTNIASSNYDYENAMRTTRNKYIHFAVLGSIPSEFLGVTLTHEHLSLDFHHFYSEPPHHLRSYVTEAEKIKLENLGVLRQYPYSSRYNINFNDDETRESVAEDLILFKKWGGGTIVENTSHGLKRDLKFYRQMALESGVNIVAGTGHYLDMTQSDSDRLMSLEAMINLYTTEMTSGVDVSGDATDFVKCGIIGEVGSGWPHTGMNVTPVFRSAVMRHINSRIFSEYC